MADFFVSLLSRLPDGYRPQGRNWVDWRYAAAQLVPQAEYGDPDDLPPFKRYPGSRDYFAPQVESTLFPPASALPAQSGRWVRRPVSQRLAIGLTHEPEFELAVDLLEIVRVAIGPYVTYGVAQLSLKGPSESAAMLRCVQALMTRYRATGEKAPSFELRDGASQQPLTGNKPLAAIADALFGGSHPNAGEQTYAFMTARIPEEVAPEDRAAWQRAIGQDGDLAKASELLQREPKHDDHRVIHLGPSPVVLFGRTAVYTYEGNVAGALRNVRSYWAETVLFALIQHAYIETYAIELARLGGEPLGPEIDNLFSRWLAFRNILWWQHPSFTTPVPRRILLRAQRELKTEPLYEDLATGFSTYVEARRHRAETTEAGALRAFQVYGTAFAVVSTLASILQVLGEDYVKSARDVVGCVAALVLAGVAAIATAKTWIGRDKKMHH